MLRIEDYYYHTTILLPAELDAKLDELAVKMETTKKELIENIVKKEIERITPRQLLKIKKIDTEKIRTNIYLSKETFELLQKKMEELKKDMRKVKQTWIITACLYNFFNQ